jgi:hypothetical protein
MNNAAVNNASALNPRALRRRVEELFVKAIQKAQTRRLPGEITTCLRCAGTRGFLAMSDGKSRAQFSHCGFNIMPDASHHSINFQIKQHSPRALPYKSLCVAYLALCFNVI